MPAAKLNLIAAILRCLIASTLLVFAPASLLAVESLEEVSQQIEKTDSELKKLQQEIASSRIQKQKIVAFKA